MGIGRVWPTGRPISVLPVASKILERAVQIQLLHHLDKSNQLQYLPSGEVFEKITLRWTRQHISRIVLGKALTKAALLLQCLSTFEKLSTV